MDEEIRSRIHHLHEVEHLSLTQIGALLGISRKKVTRILRGGSQDPGQPKRESVISPYERLIQQWYSEYPCLKAIQVLDRLRSYGFTGGYTSVKEYTRSLVTVQLRGV